MGDDDDTVWVLYVARRKTARRVPAARLVQQTPTVYCDGSRACMKALDELELHDHVIVQDCDVMRAKGVKLPPFLKGTPTLVHRHDWRLFTGTEALVHLTTHVTQSTQSAEVTPDAPVSGQDRDRTMPPPPRGRGAQQVEAPPAQPMQSSGLDMERPPFNKLDRGWVIGDDATMDDDEDGDASNTMMIGNLVENPPEDDIVNQNRITEADLEAMVAARKAMDQSVAAGKAA